MCSVRNVTDAREAFEKIGMSEMSQMPERLLKNWNVRNVTDAREDFEKNGMSEMSQMPEDFEKKWNVRNVRNVNEDFEKFRVLCQKCHRCQRGF